jgi:hypothetical protein
VIAVIGLDASYGTSGGSRVLKQISEYDTARKLNAALLDLRRADGSQGVKVDLSGIDALQWAEVQRKIFPGAFHGDFTEWGMVAFKLSIPMPQNTDGHTREVGHEVNREICREVLEFLTTHLH